MTNVYAWTCIETKEVHLFNAFFIAFQAQVEQMRAQAQANMVKKIALASQRSEEKRARAEARRNKKAEKVAAQAEYIRHSGRLPTSSFICCGWSRDVLL